MEIISVDYKKSVNIGSSDIWQTIFYTAKNAFQNDMGKVEKALKFMESGKASAEEGYAIGKQFNIIRDVFATIKPQDVIYDINDITKKAPWSDNISPVVSSCANFFTTADGKDLFFEVVSIFVYSFILKVDIKIQ